MSARLRPGAAGKRARAHVFAALDEAMRLSLDARLSGGERQAITKHLRMLESAGLVRSSREGREQLFEFRPETIAEVQKYLGEIALQWDQAPNRLNRSVEDQGATHITA